MRLVQLKQGEQKRSRRHRLSLWGWAGGDLGDKGHLCSTGDAQGSLSLTVTTNQRAYTLSGGKLSQQPTKPCQDNPPGTAVLLQPLLLLHPPIQAQPPGLPPLACSPFTL